MKKRNIYKHISTFTNPFIPEYYYTTNSCMVKPIQLQFLPKHFLRSFGFQNLHSLKKNNAHAIKMNFYNGSCYKD